MEGFTLKEMQQIQMVQLTEISKDLSEIKEHLKTLNGKVARHEQDLAGIREGGEERGRRIAVLELDKAKFYGFIAAIVTIVTSAVNLFFRIYS